MRKCTNQGYVNRRYDF